jgi:DNA polymerase III gamma/tau subunit
MVTHYIQWLFYSNFVIKKLEYFMQQNDNKSWTELPQLPLQQKVIATINNYRETGQLPEQLHDILTQQYANYLMIQMKYGTAFTNQVLELKKLMAIEETADQNQAAKFLQSLLIARDWANPINTSGCSCNIC